MFLRQNIHYIWWHPRYSLISRVLSILRTLFGPCKFPYCLFLLPATVVSWIVIRLSLLRYEQRHTSLYDRCLWTILHTHPYGRLLLSLSLSPSSISHLSLSLFLYLFIYLSIHLSSSFRFHSACLCINVRSLEH